MKIRTQLLTLLLLVAVIPFAAHAQATSFGKNKVQYKHFDWYYIQSDHFDIYFSQGGEYLASYTADMAESSYTSIAHSFRYQITNRIPIIVYNSHNDFQQTNVVNAFLEEGIGGVTELFKNRVALPFEGEYAKFRHVIHHELVHAVINDMFYGGSIQSIISNNITLQLPLWFNEGLAEYEALQWDTNSDMFLRDATINENLPPIPYLGGYFAYRGGQSVWNYIATKYGEQKIGDILLRIRSARNLDEGFRSAIGLNVEELSERWQKEQKVLYWPDIAKREDPADYARRLTDHEKDGSFYNTSPAISPQGDKIAFISNRDDYFDVFLMNAIDGTMVKKVVKGQRTPDFEELHLLTPGMTWSPNGKRLALAAKSGEHDAIIIIDTDSDDEEKIDLELDGIFSVDWSPREDKLVFIGNDKHRSDVYTYDLTTKTLTNLTDDIFSDADPVWSHDGSRVFFSSDRGEHTDPSLVPPNFKMQTYDGNQLDMYAITVGDRQITRITDLPGSDETSPAAAPDGKHLIFISDLNGINNIYIKDLERDSLSPLTNSLSGVYQLSLSRDGNKLAFGSLVKGGFDIFLMRTPLDRKLKVAELEPTEFIKRRTSQENRAAQQPGAGPDTLPVSDDVIIRTDIEDSANTYDDKAKIDFRNYVFEDAFGSRANRQRDTSSSIAVTNNVDQEGRYIINKYKLDFSPDIVYGNAGFNTYYGVQGSTIMAFSDMLGDHQLYILTNLLIDLKNSDYALAYLYLPRRIDYGIEAFHSARFILLDDGIPGGSIYRFRNYGVTGLASLPLNKFNRFEFNFSWLNLTRDNIDYTNVPSQKRSLFVPSVSYVHDNALWGYIAPANGERYNIGAMASPKIGGNALGFYTLTLDYRRYFKLWQNYTFAFRVAGGGSFGEDPQRFVLGGVDNWVNRRFENNYIPLDNAEDFVFLTSAIPMRGYNYSARLGTKYALVNSEFRFPFFGYFAAGPLPVFFQSLNGVLFLDVGGAWSGRNDFRAFDRDGTGSVYMKDLLVGTGTGLRMIFLGFLVKMDVAWSFNLQGFSRPKYYFSLGTDF